MSVPRQALDKSEVKEKGKTTFYPLVRQPLAFQLGPLSSCNVNPESIEFTASGLCKLAMKKRERERKRERLSKNGFLFCGYCFWMYDKNKCKILYAYNFIQVRGIIAVRESCPIKGVSRT